MLDEKVKEYVNDFIKWKKDRNQINEAISFKSYLKRFVDYIDSNKCEIQYLKEIDRKDIEDYIKFIKNVDYKNSDSGYRNSFVYRNLRAVYKFFEYMTIIDDELNTVKSGLIKREDFPNPNKRGVKHFPKWFDDFLISRIKAISESTKGSYKFKCMMLCIYYTGARISDLVSLEADCLIRKLDRNWIRIFSNKTKKYYEIPINDYLFKKLSEYKSLCELCGEFEEERWNRNLGRKVIYLFATNEISTEKKIFAKKISKYMNKVLNSIDCEKYDVEEVRKIGLTSHKFRHNIGIKLTRLGADPLLVAEFLGHSNLAMAQAYIQESDFEINEIMDELIAEGIAEEAVKDNFDDILIMKKEEVLNATDVVSKVLTGWCTHLNGKTICGDNPYECWLCDNLKPNYDDEKYINYLENQLEIHEELLERNLKFNFEIAVETEKKIIKKILEFIELVGEKNE